MNRTQCAQIIDYLATGHSLSPLQALDKFNCWRLGGRIYELRQAGHRIKTRLVKIGSKHVASYSLQR
jgi:hypothetical protein